MIAAATGFTVVRMQGGEAGPALGAARLACMGATGEPAEAVCKPPKIADITTPGPGTHDGFRETEGAIHGPLCGGKAGVPAVALGRASQSARIAFSTRTMKARRFASVDLSTL